MCRAGLVVIDGLPKRVEVEARGDGNIYLSGVQDKVEVELTGAGIVAVTGGRHYNDRGRVNFRLHCLSEQCVNAFTLMNVHCLT